MKTIEETIKSTTKENQDKVDWTKAWSKEYPVLKRYQDEVDTKSYEDKLDEMLETLMKEHGYSYTDAMLVLKDILYHQYLKNK
ncbi:MAG: hypothetical protein MJZ34_14785 [Paludibacteraceae bacterium]|nr:hypothetical protein [Paludibacteraceae bacterium]